jgi:hypothetical protein
MFFNLQKKLQLESVDKQEDHVFFLELLCGFISYSMNLISMVALEKQS